MEITRPAVAGTLESSDCQVMIEEGDGKVEFSLESSVISQYGNQIRKVALETLNNLGVNNAKVTMIDKGGRFKQRQSETSITNHSEAE